MNLKQVNTAIMQGNWTNDDLNSMIDAVKWRRAQLAKTVKNQLSPGTAVRFNSQKLGGMVSGTLESVVGVCRSTSWKQHKVAPSPAMGDKKSRGVVSLGTGRGS
jgi:hypothetical protein